MRGTMLWFNGDKDLGEIEADDGERLPVQGAAFTSRPPEGRCRGTVVEFAIVDGEERQAADVRVVTDDAPRRARRRSGRSYA
jgi:cold shock CspA family protein